MSIESFDNISQKDEHVDDKRALACYKFNCTIVKLWFLFLGKENLAKSEIGLFRFMAVELNQLEPIKNINI